MAENPVLHRILEGALAKYTPTTEHLTLVVSYTKVKKKHPTKKQP